MAAILDALLYTFNSKSSSLNYGEAIKFNFNYASNMDVIKETEDNSTFLILRPGKYLVNWWVGTQSGSYGPSVAFAIRYKKNNQVKFRSSASPLKTGTLNGTCILDVTVDELPFSFDLANVTGYSDENNPVVVLALETVVQSGLTVIELEPEGTPGPKGDKGEPGEKGDTGETGPRGERGLPGIRGDIGPRGLTGDRGLRGLTGEKGETGATGKDGTARKVSSASNSITSINNKVISIPYRSPIIFNTSDTNFVLDGDSISSISSIKFEENGDITFLETGLYDLTWYICIEGIEQVSELAFSAIEIINDIPNFSSPLIHCSYPPLVLGATHAQGLIPIKNKTTIRIINSSIPSGDNTTQGAIQLTKSIPVKGIIKIIAYTIGY